MVRKIELKIRYISFKLLQYHVIFHLRSYTDLISSLLDLRHVDPGSTLIHVGAYYLTNSI